MAARYKLEERTEIVIDAKDGEMRLAKKEDISNRFLLGAAGAEIEMAVAVKLGLVKAAKAPKEDKEK